VKIPSRLIPSKRWLPDFIFLAVFFLYSITYFMGVWNSIYPLGLITGDSGNIASFVAARLYPQVFEKDFVFNTLKNFQFYATIHIPLLAFLHKTLHFHLGKVFLLLLLVQIFLQLSGFYALGRIIFKSRVWAFLFTVLNLITFWSPGLGDYWGILAQPQPRFLFQAFLPLLIIPAIIWRNAPVKWPWIMIIAGLMVYIHPVSSPAWSLAIWLGLCFYLPGEWSFRKKVLTMLGLGAIYVGMASIFIGNYVLSHASSVTESYEIIFSTMVEVFKQTYYLTPEKAVAAFFTQSQYPLLIISGVIGAVITWLKARKERDYRLPFIWLAGISLVSVIIPVTERTVEKIFHLLPYELDLIRGVRFFYPFLIYFSIQGILELQAMVQTFAFNRLRPASSRFLTHFINGAFIILTVLAIIKLSGNSLTDAPESALSCWANKQLKCPSNAAIETIQTLNAVKDNVPQEASILPVQIPFDCLIIRYYTIHSLAFCYKDAGITSYTNPQLFLRWVTLREKISRIENESNTDLKAKGSIQLARELGAEYILAGFDFPENERDYMIVYRNPASGTNLVQILQP
jgi:hypothetical protein